MRPYSVQVRGKVACRAFIPIEIRVSKHRKTSVGDYES